MTVDHKVPKHIGSITLAVGNPNWGLEQCERIVCCHNAINKKDELLHCIYPISPSPRIHLVIRDAEDFAKNCVPGCFRSPTQPDWQEPLLGANIYSMCSSPAWLSVFLVPQLKYFLQIISCV